MAKFTHSCQARAWLAWRSHTQRRQVKAAMLQHAVGLWAGHTAAAAFQRWRSWAAASRQQRGANAAAAQLYARQLQARVLLALWLAMARRRELRRCGYQAVGHMTGWLLALRFRAWRVAAARQARLCQVVQQLAVQTTQGRLARIVMLWRWWAARRRFLRQVSLQAADVLGWGSWWLPHFFPVWPTHCHAPWPLHRRRHAALRCSG